MTASHMLIQLILPIAAILATRNRARNLGVSLVALSVTLQVGLTAKGLFALSAHRTRWNWRSSVDLDGSSIGCWGGKWALCCGLLIGVNAGSSEYGVVAKKPGIRSKWMVGVVGLMRMLPISSRVMVLPSFRRRWVHEVDCGITETVRLSGEEMVLSRVQGVRPVEWRNDVLVRKVHGCWPLYVSIESSVGSIAVIVVAVDGGKVSQSVR